MDHVCEYLFIIYACILIFKCDLEIIHPFVVHVYPCVVRLGNKRLHSPNCLYVGCFYTVTHYTTVEMNSERESTRQLS